MIEIGVASVVVLAGLVLGIGSVFLSMWFLPTLIRRLGMVTVITPANNDKPLQGSLPGNNLQSENKAGIQPIKDAMADPWTNLSFPIENPIITDAGITPQTDTKTLIGEPPNDQRPGEQQVSVVQKSDWPRTGNPNVNYGITTENLSAINQTVLDMSVGSDSTKKQDFVETELIAAIVTTLYAYGLYQNESCQIKQIRLVN